MKLPSRRHVLAGLVGLSACAALPLFPLSKKKKSKVPLKEWLQPQDALGISIVGTFAILIDSQNIKVYAPEVTDGGKPLHYYCVAKPDTDPQINHKLFDMKPGQNQIAGLIGSGTKPTFIKGSTADNNIDRSFNLVLDNKKCGSYRHFFTLPYPDNILFDNKVLKGSARIFANKSLDDYIYIFRDHRLIYNKGRFDLSKFSFDGQPIQFLPTEEQSIRILSEPFDLTTTATDCKGHIQHATAALATMLGMGSSDLDVNTDYCGMAPTFAAARLDADCGDDDEGGAVKASRFPACMTAIVGN